MTIRLATVDTRAPYTEKQRFERMVERHRDALASYARRLARNSADAEDLVQETMLRAYVHRDTLRETGSIAAWLCVTLRHLFINQRRRQARAPYWISVDDGNLPEIADSPQDDPERVLIRQMENAAVHKAMESLPESYRAALVLSDIEGLSYAEIAERLTLPMGTVRSRISRARQRVQRSLFAWRGAYPVPLGAA